VRTGTSTEQAKERFRSVSCGVRVRGARASEVPFRPTAHGRKGFDARRTQVRRAERMGFVRPGGSSAFSASGSDVATCPRAAQWNRRSSGESASVGATQQCNEGVCGGGVVVE